MTQQHRPNEEPLRNVHRAYVEAGLLPLSDYVSKYSDEPLVKPLNSQDTLRLAHTFEGLPMPDGVAKMFRLMGIDATGVHINGSTGFTVTDKHGSTYTFQLSRFQRKD